MQIKRFEADDMTEALRMVKKEFDDDAVILSAKEVRSGGFFSAWRKTRVEITAAADYPIDDTESCGAFSQQLSQQLDIETETDRVSLSGPSHQSKPLAPQAPPRSNQPPVPEVYRAPVEREVCSISKLHRSTTAIPVPEKATRTGMDEQLAVSRVSVDGQGPTTGADRVVKPFYRDLSTRKIIAFVGPCGAGKSTTVAKLAAHCGAVEKKRVGLISLDRYTIVGNSLLEKVARIMDVPFAIAHDADQLQSALNDQADVDIVLVDTPGVGGRIDASMLESMSGLLRLAKPFETHLVVNATVRETVLAHAAETFLPMGIDHLLFTHMDEYGSHMSVNRLIENYRLPSSFFTDGVDLIDHLQETTLDRLRGFSGHVQPAGDPALTVPARTGHGIPDSPGRHDGDSEIQFVANRNSELFHHPHCKSVKRINVENITGFNSIEQAMDEGFKPCRACCNIDVIRKVVPTSFGHQRMHAI